MKYIDLVGIRGVGLKVVVDDEDYDRINKYRWVLLKNRSGNCYAVRASSLANPYTMMHRMVLGVTPHDRSIEIDHINRNGLDNRKQNLRVCSKFHNSGNRIGRRTRRFKGVSRIKATGHWRAYINIGRHQTHLGVTLTEEAAAKLYDAAARQYFGEFAYLNFPDVTALPLAA